MANPEELAAANANATRGAQVMITNTNSSSLILLSTLRINHNFLLSTDKATTLPTLNNFSFLIFFLLFCLFSRETFINIYFNASRSVQCECWYIWRSLCRKFYQEELIMGYYRFINITTHYQSKHKLTWSASHVPCSSNVNRPIGSIC